MTVYRTESEALDAGMAAHPDHEIVAERVGFQGYRYVVGMGQTPEPPAIELGQED